MSNYESEELFMDMIEKCLKENRIKVWREVVPDQCINWRIPYRVDLIFYLPEFGYIGVEGKNIRSPRSGGIIASAVEQIKEKYANKTYFSGNIISKWCITFPASNLDSTSLITFIQTYLKKRENISLLRFTEEGKWRTAMVDIDYSLPNKIRVGGEQK